ncbi:MAG: hypothetical protein R6U03_07990, partial [Gillisia sp.]
ILLRDDHDTRDEFLERAHAAILDVEMEAAEQWLETTSNREKEELSGNPAHQPKKPSERKGGDSMFEGESHIAGDKG